MTTKFIRLSVLAGAFVLAAGFSAIASAQDNQNAPETGIGKNCSDPNGEKPDVTLDADRVRVLAGTRVHLVASGKSLNNKPIEYMWRSDNGAIFGHGNAVDFDTTGLVPGTYDVKLFCRDGHCALARIVKPIEVIGCPPNLGLVATSMKVNVGEKVTVRADGGYPDLGLQWTTSEGRLVDSGSSATIDTAGVAGNFITVGVTTPEIPGCGSQLQISIVKPVILPDIINFPMNGGRLNNANKSILDDVNLRAAKDVTARIVITGKSTASERTGLARQRAENARNYLVGEKGIDPARIEIRSEEKTAAEGGIQVAIIPPGAQMP